MELRYSFDELFLRETKECIQKGSKYELIFKKLNASSKKFISIKNDCFNDFIEFDCSIFFYNWNISRSDYREVIWKHQVALDLYI